MSWDPAIATIQYSNSVRCITWSPCSRFIAISLYNIDGIQILDAVTLKQLKLFMPPHHFTELLAFSPESRLLTWVSFGGREFVSWDVQTGVLVSKISIEEKSALNVHSITHSWSGTMFGVLSQDCSSTSIDTYNTPSCTPICNHQIKGLVIGTIWTCGECLQFATLQPGFITMWEVGFASKHSPIKVKSPPTPNGFNPSNKYLFIPSPSRLAFILDQAVLVWDVQNSKPLLNSVDITMPSKMSFSSDGCFFICKTKGLEIYLWKESPTGYILYKKFQSEGYGLLAPTGQSIIVFYASTLELWCTIDLTTSPSNALVQTHQPSSHFVLGFSPDRSLVGSARSRGNTATVLNLKSGVTQLIVDTGMEIYGLGVTGSTIIVVGNEKIITWNLPVGNCIPNVRANTSDSVQTTTFNHSLPIKLLQMHSASVSPDSNQILIMGKAVGTEAGLNIYDVSTGKHLAGTFLPSSTPWFTPNGHEIWSWSSPREEVGWAIVKDSESNVTKLVPLDPTQSPLGGYPWESSYGYQVTDDGWVLDSSRKQLLWLPHHWRRHDIFRMWNGRFFAISHGELPEVVVLEFPE